MIAVVLLLLLIIYLLCSSKEHFKSKRVCNDVDQRCYKVASEFDSSTIPEASKLLAQLNKFSIEFMRWLRERYVFAEHAPEARSNMVKYLLKNYDPTTLIENVPLTQDNTSYVENKGDVFALCLRERLSGKHKFHDLHTLQFVMLHELAHLGSFTVGHNEEFWTNFKILLQEAKAAGLHQPTDYAKHPVHYCSITIDYSPYYDPDL